MSQLRFRSIEDGWVVVQREDGEEVLRFKAPPGATHDDYKRFARHLMQLAEQAQHGLN